MNSFREVNDDILRDWLSFREEMVLGTLTKEDRKHYIYFDEIAENILKNVPKQNQKYVKNQLDRINKKMSKISEETKEIKDEQAAMSDF